MDPLTPLYVRLKSSTVEALREATKQSSHRSVAAFLDELVRKNLILEPRADDIERLRQAAEKSR